QGNIVHDNGLGGITGFGVNHTLDYVNVASNLIYRNAFYSTSGGSGISLYELSNFDTASGVHNSVTGNLSWGNRMFVNESGFNRPVDGNGCIIDDGQHTQHTALGASYSGTTLVENNVFAGNGGTGCHSYRTDNVNFFNNTAYHNLQSAAALRAGGANAGQNDGQIGAFAAKNNRFFNNIAMGDGSSSGS